MDEQINLLSQFESGKRHVVGDALHDVDGC